MTAEIVRSNRRGGPEGVIDAVEQLAPDGFTDIDKVLSYAASARPSCAAMPARPALQRCRAWPRCGRNGAEILARAPLRFETAQEAPPSP